MILGGPFLLTYPVAYIHRSFDLGRQFFYIWTVNWKCVPEDIFLSKAFQISLLALHLIVLVCFLNKSLKNIGGLSVLFNYKRSIKLNSDCNFLLILHIFVHCFKYLIFYSYFICNVCFKFHWHLL